MKKLFRPFTVLIGLHVLVILLAIAFLIRQKGTPLPDREKILVVPIEGVISFDKAGFGSSLEAVIRALETAGERPTVKAVVLRINSPGGSVGAVQEIYRAVQKVRAKGKIVVSSFGDVAASGGYYVACGGDAVFANPGTLTGSIGVIMQLPNVQGLLQKVGISVHSVKSGDMKDAGSPFRPLTENEKEHFKRVILDAYDQFVQAVREGRKLDEEALKRVADGRVFSGRMALEEKLVDGLGGLEEAVEHAKKLAGLKDKKPQIIHHREKPSLERLLRLFSKSPVADFASLADRDVKLLYQFP